MPVIDPSAASPLPDCAATPAPPDPSRRRILIAGASLAAAGLLSPFARASGSADPFTLGVAAGDPLTDGFVLWTRLAPRPLDPDGRGGLRAAVPVRWQVASDPQMRTIVRQGETIASPVWGHAVHVELTGLAADRPYWYCFQALGARSPIGSARTLPAAHRTPDAARFGFVSCSHWELGYFSAYRHLAAEQPDLVFFLGDYIYEYSNHGEAAHKIVRPHGSGECLDLAGYRNRYALYRTDPDLQALHAGSACVATWDDHEVQNDYANRWSQDPSIPVDTFLARRAAAYRAFYEHFPLRARHRPHGADMRIYRSFDYGQLARFYVLDGRQYRSEQPCPQANGWRGGHVVAESCRQRTDPQRTMLGWEQERWLHGGFAQSPARWNVIAQDLLVAPMRQAGRDGVVGHWTDGWDGYPATRERMLDAIANTRLRNPVFWGGDIHSYWVTDLKADPGDDASATLATEFVGTSITSDGQSNDELHATMAANPHVHYVDGQTRGYVSVTLTPGQMETRLQGISDRRDRNATVSTTKRFVVEDGRPGAVEA
ncbi:alkaline phosphatase D family protein [Xanthomonas perforans]|uniref:Alkaline phosphatase D family protein n=1 Tax=Xanthomonas euvesicatoria TaxID=456327 RepID=A0AAX4FLK5_XANEU|nr:MULTISPECIES: alkaline phosphatase D family protein [Xanthomonas]MBZ2603924.1 alkaline phosphatase D family protein [Xanthomonas perforans]MBZ2746196.1 alkaline phosphatase D family protein [Xanthomonas perforans]MBZ3073761.1 alkaline phosphatase D family protein [Xanthomonas perforans]MBZ3142729.1 alkaline phosphatase D family protein [Xanthomonas perforans]MBZ3152322.1 alkaline phosphatase D family protein [Xanthomonas perforans]